MIDNPLLRDYTITPPPGMDQGNRLCCDAHGSKVFVQGDTVKCPRGCVASRADLPSDVVFGDKGSVWHG